MPLFHKHVFKESTTKPGMLFCECGKIKCLHDFVLKEELYSNSKWGPNGDRVNFTGKSFVYECSICKKLKIERL